MDNSQSHIITHRSWPEDIVKTRCNRMRCIDSTKDPARKDYPRDNEQKMEKGPLGREIKRHAEIVKTGYMYNKISNICITRYLM